MISWVLKNVYTYPIWRSIFQNLAWDCFLRLAEAVFLLTVLALVILSHRGE